MFTADAQTNHLQHSLKTAKFGKHFRIYTLKKTDRK